MAELEIVPFYENAVYTTEQTARILQRCPKTVRFLCSKGILPARKDRGGFIITGRAIRAYVEKRVVVDEKQFVK